MMTVRSFVNAPVTSNCYVLFDKDVGEDCIIIDPGSRSENELVAYLMEEGLTPRHIILTHEHFDHCWGVNQLVDLYHVPIVCSRLCAEAIYGTDGKVYILELGARSGGSLIPQVTAQATGVDMVPYVIKAAMGEDCSDLKMAPVKGFWSNYMAHLNETGLYDGIEYDKEFGEKHLVDYVTDTQLGDPIHKYRDAQDCVGELILKYGSQKEMFEVIENMDRYFKIKTK